jgi:glycosyltransferase involved in cell wall biosynthesis
MASAVESVARGAFHVGWLAPHFDINSASSRYRCLHIARVLSAMGVRNSFFTDARTAHDSMEEMDAIVVVKRIDPDVIKVVAKAQECRKAVFLDFSDDLLHERYGNNAGGRHMMVFAGIAPYLDGIVTPSLPLAQRIAAYCRDAARIEVPVHVIPDIAETDELFWKTAAFAEAIPGPNDGITDKIRKKIERVWKKMFFSRGAAHAAISRAISKERRRILWFGNYGGPHSNFGIASLIPLMQGISSIYRKREPKFELIVVSNDAAVHDALIRPFGVPTRHITWSPESVYAELRKADVALLSTGDDDFCTGKSSNRILQALAMGVPVLTTSPGKAGEFIDCIRLNQTKQGLIDFLGPDREEHLAKAMAAAQKVLARYSPDTLGSIWHDVLANQIEKKKKPPTPGKPGDRLVFIVETGAGFEDLDAVLAHCKEEKIAVDVIATVAAFKNKPELALICGKNQVIPTVIKTGIYPHRLSGASQVVIETLGKGKISNRVIQWARELGIPVQALSTLRQTPEGARQGLAPASAEAARAVAKAGPYPERLNADGSADWTFIVHEKARGWILEAICREIGSRQPGTWQVVYLPEKLPPARNYFFSHHSLFLRYFKLDPAAFADRGSFIWYTHPHAETPESIQESLDAFNRATQVIFTCSMNMNLWISRGLNPEKGRVVLGGADSALFTKHERGRGVIGLSSWFYERKNPDCMLELIKQMPHHEFHLIGRRWEEYALFEKMRAASNFKYLTIPYEQYPDAYRNFDVFLSISKLEGGPIPLLEAMMCNAVPVSSHTGFAPDLIKHGQNGFLFDVNASAREIAPLIEAAFALDTDIRSTVVHYSWDYLSQNIVELGK